MPSKTYPNWDFWFENVPSGNPVCNCNSGLWKEMPNSCLESLRSVYTNNDFCVASCRATQSDRQFTDRIVTNFGVASPCLPDGFFSNQKSHFRQIMEGLVDIFYDHLEFFTDVWDLV
jgi:hypothetical protein